MNFDIIATEPFERKLKRLAKKYKSLLADLSTLFDELSENPTFRTSIGNDCYKIRIAITS
jgi:mRNA-degrading endonuclease RelE of RelBE toxin-antitoxin system